NFYKVTRDELKKFLAFKKNIEYKINDMKKLAHDVGLEKTDIPGKYLSTEYANPHTRHLWKCGRCGYEFKLKPFKLKYNRIWCPKCTNTRTNILEDSTVNLQEDKNNLGIITPEELNHKYSERKKLLDNNLSQNEWVVYGIDKIRHLKYSFNRKDNGATRLIKTILNQIYENKRALEQYHFKNKEKNEFSFLKGKDIFYPQQKVFRSISYYNLSKFFGVSRSKARNWLITLDKNNNIRLPDLEFRKIRATILRLFQGEGKNINKSQQIIKITIDKYLDKYYNKMDFIAQIVLLLDDCAFWEKDEQSKKDPHSLLSISKRMGMNRDYLFDMKKRLRKLESYKYSRYFTLTTNILLLKFKSFKFKDKKNYKNFKFGALDIVFQEMVTQGIFSEENAEMMRKQYDALVYTLYALTKVRYKKQSLLGLKSFSIGKDNKGIYTLSDLSREIGGRKLFADYLLYEIFISRETLAEIKYLLDKNKINASVECESALNLLNEIPRIRLGQRPSYVGRQSHPILENFFRKLWLKLGIISRHEYQFNYPNSLHRIDSALEVNTQQRLINILKSSSDSSLSKFQMLFIDYTIPNFVKLDYCVLGKISPKRQYLDEDRAVIIVFYGIYTEKVFKELQKRLNSLNLDYKENVRFMDIFAFIELFTNDADDLRKLNEIDTLIKKALDDDNEKALKELEGKADDALYDLSKINK
ncbi:MAG: hypothetical protein KGD63_06645, partial [Candidatus Lokiarchaeota archaeon]|nr:hypothetical protein [Candidatus Lokiarchaeota archaeon]